MPSHKILNGALQSCTVPTTAIFSRRWRHGWPSGEVAEDAALKVNGRELKSARTFADVPEGTAFWYENSNRLVEIAVNRGRAEADLELGIGAVIGIHAPG